jgi:hypothetical protein
VRLSDIRPRPNLVRAPQVNIYLPDEALRAYVTFYYFVSSDGPLTDFLYPEWGNVRLAVAGDWRVTMEGYGPEAQVDTLFGPTDRCGDVSTAGGRTVGFGMTPLGWNRLIGTEASLMANRVRPLSDALGPPARRCAKRFPPTRRTRRGSPASMPC